MVRLLPALMSSLAVPLILLLRRPWGPGDRPGKPAAAGADLDAGAGADDPAADGAAWAGFHAGRHPMWLPRLLGWWGWFCGSTSTPGEALVAGRPASGILLLKPPVLGFGLIAALVGGRRCWPNGTGWLALAMGLLPGVGWHLWHWHARGSDALLMWGGQGLARITNSVGDGLGWWTPWVELLEGGWPWLLLLPAGLACAWRQRWSASGRWELGLLIGSAALVMPLRTQLPWYSHLLWPPLALLCGEGLHDLVVRQRHRWVSWSWCVPVPAAGDGRRRVGD